MREHLRELGLGDEAALGLELAGMIRMLGNLYESAVLSDASHDSLSTARWAILFALRATEQHGGSLSATPTVLSMMLRVSKNTVSSLLRGLEEQGLIERTLDAEDRRLFHIRLTAAGRERIATSLPERVERMNKLASGLNTEEQEQLVQLLEKLRASLLGQLGHCHAHWHAHESASERVVAHHDDHR